MPKRKFVAHRSDRKPRRKQDSRSKQTFADNATNDTKSNRNREDDAEEEYVDDSDHSVEDAPASQLLLSTFGSNLDRDLGNNDGDSEPEQNISAETVSVPNDEELDVTKSDDQADLDDFDEDRKDTDDEQLLDVKKDPFIEHFETLLTDHDAEAIKRREGFLERESTLPSSGTVNSRSRVGFEYVPSKSATRNAHVRENLARNLPSLVPKWSNTSDECFDILNHYQDLFHFQSDQQFGMDCMRAYALHILNHVLKTRNRIISHNSKLARKHPEGDVPDFRDQGYSRPKVLILMPFRHKAFKLFEMFCDLLNAKEDTQVMNRKRFMEEFGWNDKDPVATSDKPDDFRHNFTGNTDDCFRIGIAIAKKTLKLYTEFYSADIIIASPLGLRMIIGNEGEKQHEYDFLSSIEILILDQADVFLMQNWEHVLHILKHMHRIPTSTKDIDFSRVRPWILNGWSAFYRQTVMLAAFRSPELQAIVNRHCFNYSGSVTFKFATKFTALSSVIVPIPHTFEKIPGTDIQKSSDARFRHFCDKVLPAILDQSRQHTMIFIPSYFDFVRMRNHFKREEISFVQICEYTPTTKVARARDLFFHGKKQILLYTERFHFYRRYRIRGIRHLIFYEAPHYSQFYSELCNMTMDDEVGKLKDASVACLFSRFDLFRLAPILGHEKAALMVQSEKPVHVFVTEPGDKTK